MACQEQDWWCPAEDVNNVATSHLAMGSGRESGYGTSEVDSSGGLK